VREQLDHQAIGALALKVCPVIRRPCFEPRDLRASISRRL